MTYNGDAEDLLTVRLNRVYNATPEAIFAAFTKPGQIVQWWGPAGIVTSEASVDLTPGGAFRVTMRAEDGSYEGPMTGRYIEIVPPTRLVFEITEHCNGAPHLFDATKLPTTTVTIELRALDADRTELTLTHTGFDNPVAADAHTGGWGSSLEKLAGTFGIT